MDITFTRIRENDDMFPSFLRGAEHAYAVIHNGRFIGYVADTGYAGTWRWQAWSPIGSTLAETTTRRDGAYTLIRWA